MEVTDLTGRVRAQHTEKVPVTAPCTFAASTGHWLIKVPALKPVLSAKE